MRVIDSDKLISALQKTSIEKNTISDLCAAINASSVEGVSAGNNESQQSASLPEPTHYKLKEPEADTSR
jgi:hypothetical protein